MSPAQKPVPRLPEFQHAITQDAKGQPQLAGDVAVPALLPGTVLVKTVAVALNPSDHKLGQAFPTEGAIIGFDFAGTVVAVGEGAGTKFSLGDRVCGAVHGSNPGEPGNGAFAEYIRAPVELLLCTHPRSA